MASDGYRNFRLRGIPEIFQSRKQVRDLVRVALKLNEDAEITVHSIARNPLKSCSRIATLTFGKSLPNLLQSPGTEWSFAIPDYEEDENEKWGPQRLEFDTHFRGFTPLHRADDSECSTDLIAISGLAGHAFGSFKGRGGSFMWLRDDLPDRLRQTRILVYGYDTRVVASKSFQNLNDLGNMFRLSVKRLQLGSSGCCQIRPAIFLGHSLGGLVVKEAIMKMNGSRMAEDKEFLDNIIAFMFFGVPHQGMATEHLFPMVGEQPNRSLIQSLGKHSAILQRYEEEFAEAVDTKEPRPEILSFYETEMSPTAKFNEEKQIWESDETRLAVLVDRSSATNGCTSGCAIARNHSEMVKFTSEMDEMYDIVLASLLPLLRGKSTTLKSLSKDQRECLKSLFFNEQKFRQAEIHDAENTCAWLLDDHQYRQWIGQSRGLLWVKGKPGAGKSVLMKYAAEKLREKSSGSRELIASFYIYGRGVDLQKKATGVYRALLHDLIPYFDDTLSQATLSFNERESRCGSYREGRWEWTERELEKLLLQVLTHASAKRRIVIFIDALDECEKDTPIKLLTCFKRFGEKIEQQNSYAKICFSSRHYPILGQARVPTILVENENREDIRRVIEEKLKDIEPDKERQNVVDVILSKNDGVFQWAVLVADSAVKKYLKGFGVQGIEREIKKLPAELDSLYAGLLDEVDEDESEKVQTIKLFRWVLFACRPLSVRELREALATDPHVSYATIAELRELDNYAKPAERFERRVIDMSKGLIQFNTRDVYESVGLDDEGSDRQAEFIHQSVSDYLLQYFLRPAESLDGSSHSSAGHGHFELSRSCLRYLTMDEIRDASKLLRVDISVRYPLVAYAIRYFFTHIQRAEGGQVNQLDLVRLLDWDHETKECMAQLWRTFDPQGSYTPVGWPFQGGNLVHILAALGSISAFKAILCEEDIEIDSKDSSNNTPLLIALSQGHQDIAQEILDRSAKWMSRHGKAFEGREPGIPDGTSFPTAAKSYLVDVNAENYDFDTPMTVAVSIEAPEVVFQLIKAGAFLKSFQPAASPLLYSIRANNRALLTELIKSGICLDGAVYYAVARMTHVNDESMEESIQILLEAGANTQASNDVVQYAMCQFPDPNYTDSGSAFQLAAHTKNLPILQLLLTHELVSTDELHHAWEIAVKRGHVSVVAFFVDHGLYTPEKVRDAWKRAVKEADVALAELLMSHVTLTQDEVKSSWIKTVNLHHLPMVELLLAHGSHTPERVRDAFQRATAGENRAMVSLILTDWPHVPMQVHAALKVAVDNGDLPMAELFLVDKARIRGVEPEVIHNALGIAVASGDEPLTEAILNNTTTMKRSGAEVHDTFVAAVESGKVSMVELLLNNRVMVRDQQPGYLYGALITAIGAKDMSLVKLLLCQRGMVTALVTNEWDYALEIAGRSDEPFMVELLSTYPADTGNLDAKTLCNTLRASVESGKVYATNVFLRWGAKFGGFQSQELRNHLVFAVESGNTCMVELLLRHGVDIDATEEKDGILATPSFASQVSRWTNQNKGSSLSGALLCYSLERHYYKIFHLLLSQSPSPDSMRESPPLLTTNAPHPFLIQLLNTKRADINLRDALQDARRCRDRMGVSSLIRLVAIVHYSDALIWPSEYPTEHEIAELLTTTYNDYHGILTRIMAKAVMLGNEKLVEFMLKYAGARSDTRTGPLDWGPGPDADERLVELQCKISEVMMTRSDRCVAPIIVAVVFKRVAIAELLLEIGTISNESLAQAGFLVFNLGLYEKFESLMAKLKRSSVIRYGTLPDWPFLDHDLAFKDSLSQTRFLKTRDIFL